MSRWVCGFAAGVALCTTVSSSAFAAVPVSSAENYVAGTGAGGYTTASSATGAADGLTGESIGFPNILSPFSPAFEVDELTGIGAGGKITLKFAAPINLITGSDFGVFTNVGLMDGDFPNGTNTNPAGTFSGVRKADVEVSLNGVNFFAIGRVTFDNPSNYFANAAGPFLTSAPADPVLADYGQPFAGSLNDFSGLNWNATLGLLNGSAGGTWIDADAAVPLLGQASLQYVRLSIPTGGIAGTDGKLFIDTLYAANAAVPEPASIACAAVLAGLVLRRR